VQARLVVITATFTYDAKSSATPTPSAQPGSCTPVAFESHTIANHL